MLVGEKFFCIGDSQSVSDLANILVDFGLSRKSLRQMISTIPLMSA